MTTRAASLAGSWYSPSARVLSDELEELLKVVGPSIEGVGNVPQPGARVIIAHYVSPGKLGLTELI